MVTALKAFGDIQKILQIFVENLVNDFSTKLQKIEQWYQDLNIDIDFKRLIRTEKAFK